ncbi:cell wall-associated NlpC family hydrolase [Sphaerotilus hippei]|uniref:Cell wall-associated NlpC family hydrolase n=1 Tax=Sphaerotilus hippei TaxID=744406 RepID=A0A318H6U5_9BURK|nr:C40 family peptidase [Sphaerotilus hippei]PXW98168.1 cell wall-associated NlpC family hydrolase [Sphaerotilus hippei]
MLGLTLGACATAAPANDTLDPISRLLQERNLTAAPTEESRTTSDAYRRMRDTASDLVLSAMNFLGVPYVRGGNTEASGFDCSGFTRHVFENSVGLLLPRRSAEQATSAGLLDVGRTELRPGDLVFFNTMRSAFSHVGIYVGDDKFIHAPRTGSNVRIEDMRQSYWQQRFDGARRVPGLALKGQVRLPADLLPSAVASPLRAE